MFPIFCLHSRALLENWNCSLSRVSWNSSSSLSQQCLSSPRSVMIAIPHAKCHISIFIAFIIKKKAREHCHENVFILLLLFSAILWLYSTSLNSGVETRVRVFKDENVCPETLPEEEKRERESISSLRIYRSIEQKDRKKWAELESIKILCCSINLISLNIYRSRYVCADSLRRSQRKTWQKWRGFSYQNCAIWEILFWPTASVTSIFLTVNHKQRSIRGDTTRFVFS